MLEITCKVTNCYRKLRAKLRLLTHNATIENIIIKSKMY